MLYNNPLLVIAEFREMMKLILASNGDEARGMAATALSRYYAHNAALDQYVQAVEKEHRGRGDERCHPPETDEHQAWVADFGSRRVEEESLRRQLLGTMSRTK